MPEHADRMRERVRRRVFGSRELRHVRQGVCCGLGLPTRSMHRGGVRAGMCTGPALQRGRVRVSRGPNVVRRRVHRLADDAAELRRVRHDVRCRSAVPSRAMRVRARANRVRWRVRRSTELGRRVRRVRRCMRARSGVHGRRVQ